MIRYERNQTIPAPYAMLVQAEDKSTFVEWAVMPLAWQPIQVGAA